MLKIFYLSYQYTVYSFFVLINFDSSMKTQFYTLTKHYILCFVFETVTF
ncbi:hypothetical protein BWR56_0862 [Streptococcus oralis]|nr:hypothetical protein BWR56_0862 [Streptococcus oralis]